MDEKPKVVLLRPGRADAPQGTPQEAPQAAAEAVPAAGAAVTKLAATAVSSGAVESAIM